MLLGEVLGEVFQFLLSVFLSGGAGFMLYHGIAPELCSAVIMAVVVYWFQGRSNSSAINNLLTKSPTETSIGSLPVPKDPSAGV